MTTNIGVDERGLRIASGEGSMNIDDDGRPAASGVESGSLLGGEGSLLHDTVGTLSRMIKDLEKQLERMLSVNEALEKDLDSERKRTAQMERERNQLRDELERTRQELTTLDDLRSEIGHLGHERSRMAATVEELGRQLADTDQEYRKAEQLISRLSAERDNSIEELQSLEAQFDRAMEMVADLRIRLASLAEERDALVSRTKAVETQLRMTEEQRDILKVEVDESRKALEEIRRQVADACVLSQRYYSQQEDSD